MTATRDENLFGRLALHYKLLTRDQLVEALRLQEREGHQRKIGEILIERGWITPERFQRLREIQREYQARLATQNRGASDQAPPEIASEGFAQPGSTPSSPAHPSTGPLPAVSAPATLAADSSSLPPLEEGTQPDPLAAGLADAQWNIELALGETPAANSPPQTAPQPSSTAAGTATRPQPTGVEAPSAAQASWLADPETQTMPRLLSLAVELGASDLHIHAGLPARLRIHGSFQPISEVALSAEHTRRLIEGILTPEQSRELEVSGQIDLAYTLPEVGRFRANVYRQQKGTDGVFRVIPPEPPSLSDLGLPVELARLANYHQGLVLITGPTGCGKSSTLAALVRIVNEERRDHIITIEDPIEFVHRPKRCVVNQRQVGSHTRSFSRAMRAALREDPDVIVVGELRDLETIALALTAAETGHLVLATLHTMNAINTINRLVGVFPPAQQSQIRTMVSESLRGITSQRLVRRADGLGRVPALELLISNKAVGNLIRENRTYQIRSVLQTGGGQGMRTLDGSLEQLVKAGLVTSSEARLHAEDLKKFPG